MRGTRQSRFFGGKEIDCTRLQSMAVERTWEKGQSRNLLRDNGGTVLMESIMVLPLLLMLITGIFQFARFWQARLLTRYAAYNAARAALVYNPLHYRIPADDPGPDAGKFMVRDGVCWLAAVQTLAWLGATPDSNPFWWIPPGSKIPGEKVPNSSLIKSQVRLVPEGCREENGWVRVTVAFDFPTLFAVFNAASLYPGGQTEKERGKIAAIDDPARYPHFTFVESSLLPKPWTTERYPHISPAEMQLLKTATGGGGA